MGERMGHLQLLLALTSAMILRSGGTSNHILLSQIQGCTKFESQVPVFIFPQNRVAQLYLQAGHPCKVKVAF
jgi:hypothetical protein